MWINVECEITICNEMMFEIAVYFVTCRYID